MKRFTENDFKELTEELHFLKTEGRKDNIFQIKEALKYGDCSHPAFTKAKNEQLRLEEIIAEYEEDLKDAVVFKLL